jgi:glycosyltransferase involved in cell wall biosynthesis
MSPTISVVIATHDRLAYLREAVASVENQTLRDWELLVVDDSSQDGTFEWLDGLTDQRATVIRTSERSERAHAFNMGLESVRSPLVVFLDDDDMLHSGALAGFKEALDNTPGAVAAIGGMRFFDNTGQMRRMPHPHRRHTRSVWPEILAGWNVGRGQAAFRTAEALEQGWDPNLLISDDTYFALRLALRGDSVVIPQVVLDKRIHPENTFPESLPETDRGMRIRFVSELPEGLRDRGASSLAFFDSWLAAHAAYHSENDYRKALKGYVRAARTDRQLTTSPLIRGRLGRAVTKSLVGSLPGSKRVVDLVRRMSRGLMRRTNRYPDLGPAHLPSQRKDVS